MLCYACCVFTFQCRYNILHNIISDIQIIYITTCKVINCSPNPKELGYKPNKPNTINL